MRLHWRRSVIQRWRYSSAYRPAEMTSRCRNLSNAMMSIFRKVFSLLSVWR